MKGKQTLKSPVLPLIIFVVILFGYSMDGKNKTTTETTTTASVESQDAEGSEEKDETSETELTDSQSQEEEIQLTDAETAMGSGKNISVEINDTYTKEVAEAYCNRNVVACSSSELTRYNETWLYRQTCANMSGYLNLAKLTATTETELSFTVTSSMEGVTAILVFPDQTYVVLSLEDEIQCTLPQGNSTIVYIGESLEGSIEVKIEENEFITCKRM